MDSWAEGWLVGSNGLYASAAGKVWERLGPYEFSVKALLRQEQRVLVAADGGLWEVDGDGRHWRQLHDETLTEVLALASAAGDPGVVAASPYGVSWGQRDATGVARWSSYTEDLAPDRRFSNALLALPGVSGRWLNGTETGVQIVGEGLERPLNTDLQGTPVRALCQALGCLWAGTDGRGLWSSVDGLSWRQAGAWGYGAVFSLAAAGDQMLVGTQSGVVVGAGTWRQTGPSVLTTAVAAGPGLWLAGASPGGLWYSDDAGGHWRQSGAFMSVRSIIPPREVVA